VALSAPQPGRPAWREGIADLNVASAHCLPPSRLVLLLIRVNSAGNDVHMNVWHCLPRIPAVLHAQLAPVCPVGRLDGRLDSAHRQPEVVRLGRSQVTPKNGRGGEGGYGLALRGVDQVSAGYKGRRQSRLGTNGRGSRGGWARRWRRRRR
jgi:hypothetical protein